jgi:glutamine phosphoribosylpyrophosphate amidotransferase
VLQPRGNKATGLANREENKTRSRKKAGGPTEAVQQQPREKKAGQGAFNREGVGESMHSKLGEKNTNFLSSVANLFVNFAERFF